MATLNCLYIQIIYTYYFITQNTVFIRSVFLLLTIPVHLEIVLYNHDKSEIIYVAYHLVQY